MKLVSLNIWQGRIVRHVARFLEQEQPDIVCLQEAYSSDHVVPTWDAFSSIQLIREVLPHEHLFFAPTYGFSVAGRPVTFGNAILSRFPIHNKHVAFTNGHFIEDLAIEDLPKNNRNYQSCRIALPDGKHISVINHHAYWDATPLGSPTGREKMEIVKAHAQTLPQPLILTGDMNVRPESETMRIFEGMLENLTGTHALPTTLTQLARAFDNKNMVACDNTLVSPDITVTGFKASDYLCSDHKPLILNFEV